MTGKNTELYIAVKKYFRESRDAKNKSGLYFCN